VGELVAVISLVMMVRVLDQTKLAEEDFLRLQGRQPLLVTNVAVHEVHGVRRLAGLVVQSDEHLLDHVRRARLLEVAPELKLFPQFQPIFEALLVKALLVKVLLVDGLRIHGGRE